MRILILKTSSVQKVSTSIVDGNIEISQTEQELLEGQYLENVLDITDFDAQHKNIKFEDNSVLMKVPNECIISKPIPKKKGGCGGCGRRRNG